jgi:hypothetical protein
VLDVHVRGGGWEALPLELHAHELRAHLGLHRTAGLGRHGRLGDRLRPGQAERSRLEALLSGDVRWGPAPAILRLGAGAMPEQLCDHAGVARGGGDVQRNLAPVVRRVDEMRRGAIQQEWQDAQGV